MLPHSRFPRLAVRYFDAQRLMGQQVPPVMAWMRQVYPSLFAHPHLEQRLWLYAVAFALQTVLFWPPDEPEGGNLHPAHPLRVLRRLVDGPPPVFIEAR